MENDDPQLQFETPEARMTLFDFAFDHAPIGVALVDVRAGIIPGNATAKLFGRRLDEVKEISLRSYATSPRLPLVCLAASSDSAVATNSDFYGGLEYRRSLFAGRLSVEHVLASIRSLGSKS